MQRVSNLTSFRRKRLAYDFHSALMGEVFCLVDNLASCEIPPQILQENPEFKGLQSAARDYCRMLLSDEAELPTDMDSSKADQLLIEFADSLVKPIITSGIPIASLPEGVVAEEIINPLMAQAFSYRGAEYVSELCYRLAAPYPH